jgi:hypothetical protein
MNAFGSQSVCAKYWQLIEPGHARLGAFGDARQIWEPQRPLLLSDGMTREAKALVVRYRVADLGELLRRHLAP